MVVFPLWVMPEAKMMSPCSLHAPPLTLGQANVTGVLAIGAPAVVVSFTTSGFVKWTYAPIERRGSNRFVCELPETMVSTPVGVEGNAADGTSASVTGSGTPPRSWYVTGPLVPV